MLVTWNWDNDDFFPRFEKKVVFSYEFPSYISLKELSCTKFLVTLLPEINDPPKVAIPRK